MRIRCSGVNVIFGWTIPSTRPSGLHWKPRKPKEPDGSVRDREREREGWWLSQPYGNSIISGIRHPAVPLTYSRGQNAARGTFPCNGGTYLTLLTHMSEHHAWGKKKIWRSSQSDWAPYLDMELCPWSPAPSVVYRKTTRPIWWWSGRTRRLQGPSTWSGIWHLAGKREESM